MATPGRLCPCGRHLSISAPGSRGRGGEAAGLRGDVISVLRAADGKGGEGRRAPRGRRVGGKEKVNRSRPRSPPPPLAIYMEINNPTLTLLLILTDCLAFPLEEGWGYSLPPHNPHGHWGAPLSRSPRCPTLLAHPAAPFLWCLLPAQAPGLRRKRSVLNSESPPTPRGAKGEVINAGPLGERQPEPPRGWAGRARSGARGGRAGGRRRAAAGASLPPGPGSAGLPPTRPQPLPPRRPGSPAFGPS